jgi:uncharacterized RDD family membrane protein YckC
MSQPSRDESIVTPEAVRLTLDVAGLGSRMIAAIIDSLIQLAAIIVVVLAVVTGRQRSTAGIIVITVVVTLVLWGYFPILEGMWGGRTVGKRAQRLRVVRVDGQPVTWGPVVVRNLLRIVDFLPTNYAVGAIAILLSRRSQRLGDMAAGTIVIREPRAPTPSPLSIDMTYDLDVDTWSLTERDYAIVRSFLERRDRLNAQARAALAAQIAGPLRRRLHGPASSLPDDEFLQAVAGSYRRRFARSPLNSAGTSPPPRPDR